MIEHNVNRQAIDQIVRQMAAMTGQGQYNLSDVLLGVTEYLGRIIVDAADTPVSGVQMAQVMEEHLRQTLAAGYTSKGYNMGGLR
jgi:hypothetical protein